MARDFALTVMPDGCNRRLQIAFVDKEDMVLSIEKSRFSPLLGIFEEAENH